MKRDQQEAEAAFAIHAALVQRELAEPNLKRNPYWIIARQDAFERSCITMLAPQ